MISTHAADTIGVNNQQPGTRHLVTCTGETRSQLYRRLKAEFIWPVAEAVKETERRRCRATGMTKTDAGQAAWDAVARNFPPVDATSWCRLMELVNHPPEATVVSRNLAVLWSATITITGALSLRCHDLGNAAGPLFDAILFRRSLEERTFPFDPAKDVQQKLQAVVDSPTLLVEEAREEFNRYASDDSAYSAAVESELDKFQSVLDLLPSAIGQQWERTIGWLCGPDSLRVKKYLLRVHACEPSSG